MAEAQGETPSPVATQGDSFDADAVISPELQSKFDEVFGGKKADEAAGEQPARKASQKTVEAKPATPVRRRPAVTEEDEADDESLEGSRGRDGESEQAAEDEQPAQPEQKLPPAKGKGQDATQTDEALLATLNPVLRHAARRGGWSDEEIASALRVNPEAAERQWSKLHGSLNEVSARFAQFGRQPNVLQTQQLQQAQQSAQQQGQSGDVLASLFGGDYAERFKNNYGETFADDVLKPLTQHVIAPLMQVQQFVQAQQLQAVATEIGVTLGRLAGELPDFYGPKTGKASDEQNANVQNLLMLADQIRTGAMAQGVPMSVSDAMDHAHLMAASEHLTQLERKKLTQQVQSRSARITARPTQRVSKARPGTPGVEKSDSAAIEAFTAKAMEIGLDD